MMERQECRKLLGSLSEYIDGALEAELCAEIERHLSECENCRIVVDSLHRTIDLYRASAQDVSVPDDVRQHLFRRLGIDEFLNRSHEQPRAD